VSSADYPVARYPNREMSFMNLRHDYGCQRIELGQTIGWDPGDNWEFAPNRWFTQGSQIQSDWPLLSLDVWCFPNGKHMTGGVRMFGASR
jgi:hypothetical protein